MLVGPLYLLGHPVCASVHFRKQNGDQAQARTESLRNQDLVVSAATRDESVVDISVTRWVREMVRQAVFRVQGTYKPVNALGQRTCLKVDKNW